MKSIQTKIIVLIMAAIILCAVVIGGLGISSAQAASDQNSEQILSLICQKEGSELDNLLFSIEQSVKVIASYSLQYGELNAVVKSDVGRRLYMERLRAILLGAAKSTQGAVAVYYHFSPEVAPPTEGLFFSRSVADANLIEQKAADLSLEPNEEIGSLEWYTKPVEAGEAIWLDPYNNGKTEGEVISYVMPIYENGVLIAVAGMDILFSDIMEVIDGIQVYESGHAYLVSQENELIYHPYEKQAGHVEADMEGWKQFIRTEESAEEGMEVFAYSQKGSNQKITFSALKNNMRLVVAVPTEEINEQRNILILKVFVGAVLITIVCIIITVKISQSIIRPLKELTEASKEVAAGNLQVTLLHKSRDEVGELSNSLQQMVDYLRIYMERMSDLAYTDPLTGVKSKTAYEEEVRKYDNSIQQGFDQFGVIMFDINKLKEMNDKHGHDSGDIYIKNCCCLVCSVFKHSPVFRIGGDEFVAILVGQDLLKAPRLVKQFYTMMDERVENAKQPEEKVCMAAGMAVFCEGKDRCFQDVFKRADEAMYENKKLMKSGQKPTAIVESIDLLRS